MNWTSLLDVGVQGLPILAFGIMVYYYMQRKVIKEKKNAEKLKLELEYHENKNKVEQATSGMSDDDIINTIANGGSLVPEPNSEEDSGNGA